jgi:beta-glucosidase
VDETLGEDVQRRIDGTLNRWWFDGVVLGRYPLDVLDDLGPWATVVQDGDEGQIGQELDWIGINYYNDHFYTARTATTPGVSPHVSAPESAPMQVDRPSTDIGWPITPQGFEQLLVRLHEDYGDALPPIYITENGAAYSDGPGADEGVHDQRRVEYYDAHLRAVASAMEQGADVHGYFAWSLLDNFEWAWGYSQRFGLVHVDYETQRRTPKASALWYRDVARANALPA